MFSSVKCSLDHNFKPLRQFIKEQPLENGLERPHSQTDKQPNNLHHLNMLIGEIHSIVPRCQVSGAGRILKRHRDNVTKITGLSQLSGVR